MAVTLANLVAAAGAKKDDGLFDSSVVGALITLIGTVLTAYVAYLGLKWNRKRDDVPPPAAGPPPLDLRGAAAKRVEALRTDGPARTERLNTSHLALERAVAALDKNKEADARRIALELLQCTDPVKAAELQDQLADAAS